VLKAREELKRAESRDNPDAFLAEDDNSSFASYLEDTSRIQEMSRSLSSFPSTAQSFNDISGRYSLRSQQKDKLTKSLSLPFCSLDTAPSFVVNSGEKSCRFLAYFTETVPENLSESVRSRKVEIVYFLEDNTIEIVEPKERNSGLNQGKVLKRHQIAKNRSNPGEVFALEDFYSGAELTIYDRKYTVISCDQWSLRFMDELGIPFGDFLPLPSTYIDGSRSVRSSHSRTSEVDPAQVHNSKKMTGFHQYGRMILRFFGVWDSQGDLFGDELQVRLHYVLADDTIEILPTYNRNSGRDKCTMLLKRTKVMKMADVEEDDLSLSTRPSTTSVDPSAVGGLTVRTGDRKVVPSRPYHWSDLHIGDMIPVAAMNVLLIDADQFTRDFYASKGMTLGDPIVLTKKVYKKQEVTIPPHTGFGSEIDSLTSCKGSLIPLPPHKDGAKLKAYQGMILRYVATIENPKPADMSRSFIVQVLLEDDTIQILEPPQRNSGHKGGVFLYRTKIESHDGSKVVQPQDIFLGAVVPIYGHRFVIHDADEFTLRHMEENSKHWVFSALPQVVAKLTEKKEVIIRVILTIPGLTNKVVNYSELDDVFKRAGLEMVRQNCNIIPSFGSSQVWLSQINKNSEVFDVTRREIIVNVGKIM